MKLRNLILMGLLSVFAFTSCKNDASERENEDLEINTDADREAELRANEERLERERNSITARIQENQDLSTFSENMNRNQVTTGLYQDKSTTMTGDGQTTQTTTAKEAQNTTSQTTGQGQTSGQGQAANGTQDQNQVNQTGNQAQMQGMVTYTIFAPSNEAYEELPENQRTQMNSNTPENRDRNIATINYLMVEEKLTEENLRQQIQNANGNYTIKTMQGENIIATLEGEEIVLKDASGNQARITETDSTASDGVVHIIDAVLMPKDPTKNAAASRMNTNRTNNTTSGGGTSGGTGSTGDSNTGSTGKVQ